MNNFDMYRLPLGLTEGVDIPLPKTDLVFTVVLPANSNEEYQSKLMSAINMHVDVQNEEVDMDLDVAKFQKAHKKIFFEDCILGASGLPDKYENAAAFLAEFALAGKYVYERAVELAAVADKEVNAALGKSESTQSGKSSGKAA